MSSVLGSQSVVKYLVLNWPFISDGMNNENIIQNYTSVFSKVELNPVPVLRSGSTLEKTKCPGYATLYIIKPSPVSCLPPPISCLPSSVSCPVSCILSPVSRAVQVLLI